MAIVDRTVLHGVDQSAPSVPKLPAQANMAGLCYEEGGKSFHVWDSNAKAWLPLEVIPFVYDFDVHGGAVEAIELDAIVPAGCIVLDGLIDVVDALTSDGSAQVAIHVKTANDILSAAVLGTNGTEGLHDIVPVGSAATSIKAAADSNVTLTVTVAALTAGKLYGFLRVLRSSLT